MSSYLNKDSLGLPPMELAEKRPNRTAQRASTYTTLFRKILNVFSTTIFKILCCVCLGVFGVVILLKLLPNHGKGNEVHKTNIIILSGSNRDFNDTSVPSDMKVYLELKNNMRNQTSIKSNIRKRDLLSKNTVGVSFENKERKINIKKARDIVINHEEVCDPEKRNEFCKNILKKLNVSLFDEKLADETRKFRETHFAVPKNNDITDSHTQKITEFGDQRTNHRYYGPRIVKPDYDDFTSYSALPSRGGSDITMKDSSELSMKDRSQINIVSHQYEPNMPHGVDYYRGYPRQQQSDCFMSRLMNQNSLYPPGHMNYYGTEANQNPFIYNNYNKPRYTIPEFGFRHSPILSETTSYHPQWPPSGIDDGTALEHVRHPQDIGISMQHIGVVKSKQSSTRTAENSNCLPDMTACSDEMCIDSDKWCDGNVDCADASDETACSCKSRVDSSRLCDGYHDCPFGEDEMGCFSCEKDQFSCDNVDASQPSSTCFLKSQRCDGVVHCSNQKDEVECNMLAPSLHEKPIFGVSHTEGYLHRNFKGRWYPVCENPYMWAHDACRRETGTLLRPPIIEVQPIDPLFKGNYIDNIQGDFFQLSENCYNNSAMYVKCQDLLCGTRVLLTSQMLLENSQKQLSMLRRLKRKNSLYHNMITPYYEQPRLEKTIDTRKMNIKMVKDSRSKRNYVQYPVYDTRMKRTESRVVGGQESEPGSWPWLVAIYGDGDFHCGGVIITSRWVVTAAHCVHSYWETYYEVHVGLLRRFSYSPQVQNHRVTHVVMNQRYNRAEMTNDLALMRVAPAIQFSRWVRPICLPSPSTAGQDWKWGPPAGTICTAVGWGATAEHGPDPDHMREVDVPVWETCKHRVDILGNEICAGYLEGGKDTCQGDSGGPLLCKNPMNPNQWYMAGIVSHGDGCGRKGEPGVYTRMSLYVGWIHYNLESKRLPILKPKYDCPGFRCISGITMCLPMERKCDRKVDCLDGEDEINCEYLRSSHDENKSRADYSVVSKNHSLTQADKNEEVVRTVDINSQSKIPQKENTWNEKNILRKEDKVPLETIPKRTKNSNFLDDTKDLIATQPKSENILETNIMKVNKTYTKERISTGAEIKSEDKDEKHVKKILNVTLATIPNKADVMDKTNMPNIDEVKSFSAETFTNEPFLTSTSTNKEYDSFQVISEEKDPFNNVTDSSFENSKSLNKNDTIGGWESTEPDKPVQQNSKEYLNVTTNNINLTSSTETESDVEWLSDNSTHKELTLNFPNNTYSQNSSIQTVTDVTEDGRIISAMNITPAILIRNITRPAFFQCRRIPEKIPSNKYCNLHPDCEDGSDEEECTCLDILSTFSPERVCDGVAHCVNAPDEDGCFTCPPGQFICKFSKVCIPEKFVCDNVRHCIGGEDESECVALTNGKAIYFDDNGDPELRNEGFLTTRHEGVSWHVECKEESQGGFLEDVALKICKGMGFGGFQNFKIKHLNAEIINHRRSRNSYNRNLRFEKLQFVRQSVPEAKSKGNTTAPKDTQITSIACELNVTNTCGILYVICSSALNIGYESGAIYEQTLLNSSPEARVIANEISDRKSEMLFPWSAEVYADGKYKCTGILVDMSWVLINHACLWDTLVHKDYVSVALGSKLSKAPVKEPFQQDIAVDAKKDITEVHVTLLHLRNPAQLSRLVRPMVPPFLSVQRGDTETCVTLGRAANNRTESVVLEEIHSDCGRRNKCFVRHDAPSVCIRKTNRLDNKWAGVIACKGVDSGGWFPAASYLESRGECGFQGHINAISLTNVATEIREIIGTKNYNESIFTPPPCAGVRCDRGQCVPHARVCDRVVDCDDGLDEDDDACQEKRSFCSLDRFDSQCVCNAGQMKCRNGMCIGKEHFGDGKDDCGDGSDEPKSVTCAHYLAKVKPGRLCDGRLHCFDRSDEDPNFCKCYTPRNFICYRSETCVAQDLVCDGVVDCPHAEDENTCIVLASPEGTPHGTGQVMQRKFGVWYTKCYNKPNHTKSQLEEICRSLGYLSGHARQLRWDVTPSLNRSTNVELDPFLEVSLNNKTTITMRRNDNPMARAVVGKNYDHCYPLYIECQ